MIFIIILLIAIIIALFALYVGAMTLLCFTNDELEKAKNIKKEDVPITEYWAARFVLACSDEVMNVFGNFIKKEA